ncbi:SMI1/KNR4 family protein [Actinoplanes sp. Pm04-4]|uniref:SMI1/KNR4 family protein n=1 Tax=Paractinoplanes pyxinae TaxID=2997416 RepID=A0ABT4AS03_9ACTN|nr:SMI1/KNR4 family protein [Actinoplanes pyxinae]MCY1137024.1 SMI1/KNR4 family protein [Actinoplanes pyxinae]
MATLFPAAHSEKGPELSVPDLIDVCSPPAGSRSDFDWRAFELRTGQPLPSDYREIVATYESGRFAGFLSVYLPEAEVATARLDTMNAEVLRTLRDLEDEYEWPYELDKLLLCGVSDNGNYLFWRTENADPEAWTIVVSDSETEEWFEFPGGLAAFLRAVVTGELVVPIFPDNLLSAMERCFAPYPQLASPASP